MFSQFKTIIEHSQLHSFLNSFPNIYHSRHGIKSCFNNKHCIHLLSHNSFHLFPKIFPTTVVPLIPAAGMKVKHLYRTTFLAGVRMVGMRVLAGKTLIPAIHLAGMRVYSHNGQTLIPAKFINPHTGRPGMRGSTVASIRLHSF